MIVNLILLLKEQLAGALTNIEEEEDDENSDKEGERSNKKQSKLKNKYYWLINYFDN